MVRNKSVDRDLYSNNVLFSNSYQNQSDFFQIPFYILNLSVSVLITWLSKHYDRRLNARNRHMYESMDIAWWYISEHVDMTTKRNVKFCYLNREKKNVRWRKLHWCNQLFCQLVSSDRVDYYRLNLNKCEDSFCLFKIERNLRARIVSTRFLFRLAGSRAPRYEYSIVDWNCSRSYWK